jgi:hypothetical protein
MRPRRQEGEKFHMEMSLTITNAKTKQNDSRMSFGPEDWEVFCNT